MGCCKSKKAHSEPPRKEPVVQEEEQDADAAIVPQCQPETPPRSRHPEFRIGLGALFPDFDCRTTKGDFRFHTFLEKHVPHGFTMLFSHPKDFTPVCTTEIGTCQALLKDFERRHVQLIGLSCDSLDQHKKWAEDVLAAKNIKDQKELGFPLIADESREIANLLGMMDPLEIEDFSKLAMPARALFLIGPDKRCRLTILYPATSGRNFAEVLRVIDSLHLTSSVQVGTPANWHLGDDVLPVLNAPEALFNRATEKTVPSGKRYMRHLKQPKVAERQKLPAMGEVQGGESEFKIKLGAVFPDFDWNASKKGIDRFHKLLDRSKGELTLFMCWPRNFDAVATTELMCCLKMRPDLKKRGVTLIGMTCDSVEDLPGWIRDSLALMGTEEFDTGFTMIADKSHHIAHELGLLPRQKKSEDTSPARALFVIDRQKKLRLSMQYPQTTGLNFHEILRALDSLIVTKDFQLATPANWQLKDRLIVDPKISTSDANARYTNLKIQPLPSANWKPPKEHYLRYVDSPVLWAHEQASLPPTVIIGEDLAWEPVPTRSKAVDEDALEGEEPEALCATCT